MKNKLINLAQNEMNNVNKAYAMVQGKLNYKIPTMLFAAAMALESSAFCMADTMRPLLTQISTMLRWVGIAVLVIGVGKFALALKDENPDGQTRAVYYAIAGAMLIGIPTIINAILAGTGSGVSVDVTW